MTKRILEGAFLVVDGVEVLQLLDVAGSDEDSVI